MNEKQEREILNQIRVWQSASTSTARQRLRSENPHLARTLRRTGVKVPLQPRLGCTYVSWRSLKREGGMVQSHR